jgi:hypothetical protein
VVQHPDKRRNARRNGFCYLCGAVGRTVIDHNDFPFETVWEWRRQNTFQKRSDELLFVIQRHQYGN